MQKSKANATFAQLQSKSLDSNDQKHLKGGFRAGVVIIG